MVFVRGLSLNFIIILIFFSCTPDFILGNIPPEYRTDIRCDLDGDGHWGSHCEGPDCEDNNPEIHPGALEICDRLDNNCDLQKDEGLECDGDDSARYRACFEPFVCQEEVEERNIRYVNPTELPIVEDRSCNQFNVDVRDQRNQGIDPGSEEHPFENLACAVAGRSRGFWLEIGQGENQADTIILNPGIHYLYKTNLNIRNRSGSPCRPLVIRGRPGFPQPVVRGSLPEFHQVDPENPSWIPVDSSDENVHLYRSA